MARSFHIFSILLLISVGLVVAWNSGIAQPGPAGKRIALLISNEHYAPAIGPLTAMSNDLETLTAALGKVGFAKGDIHVAKDTSRRALRKAIRDHARRLKVAGKGAVGLLQLHLQHGDKSAYTQNTRKTGNFTGGIFSLGSA